MKYGKQIAVIVYGAGINFRHYAREYIARGLIVIYDSGFARVHEPA